MSLRKPVEGAPKQHFPSALRGLASQAGRRLRKLALADPSPCRQRALRSVVLLLLLLLLLLLPLLLLPLLLLTLPLLPLLLLLPLPLLLLPLPFGLGSDAELSDSRTERRPSC